MTREDLQGLLDRLRREIDDIEGSDAEVHERLTALVGELETRMDAQHTGENEPPSSQNINSFIEQFEVDHPRATGILNDIMVALSNMGI